MLRDLVDEGPAIPRRPWVGQGGGSAPGGATYGPLRGRRGCDAPGSTSWFGNVKLFLSRLASAVHVQDERAFITRLSSWRGQLRGSGATRLAPRGPGQACCSRSKNAKTLGRHAGRRAGRLVRQFRRSDTCHAVRTATSARGFEGATRRSPHGGLVTPSLGERSPLHCPPRPLRRPRQRPLRHRYPPRLLCPKSAEKPWQWRGSKISR